MIPGVTASAGSFTFRVTLSARNHWGRPEKATAEVHLPLTFEPGRDPLAVLEEIAETVEPLLLVAAEDELRRILDSA